MSAPEYRLASIADFLSVPADKMNDCLRDFASWLTLARKHQEVNAAMTELLGGGVAFEFDHFFWIDDGAPGLSAIQVSEKGGDRVARIQVTVEGA